MPRSHHTYCVAVAPLSKPPLAPAETFQTARTEELRFHLLLLTAAVLIGALLQVDGPPWLRAIFEAVRLDSLAGLLNLLLAFLASILAHELGHLCAALYLDFTLMGAALGPFQLDVWHSKFIVCFRAGQWTRCSVSAIPRGLDDSWRGRMLTVIAAGPIVSLLCLLASACLALNQTAPVSFWSSCAEVNFFLAILGLVPNSRSAAVRNDAAFFLALWRNAADAQDVLRCHQAIELTLRGLRPGDFPQPLLHELSSFTGRPYTRLIVAQRMVEWAIDSGDISLASAWDEAALSASVHCGPRPANRALAESACFDVLFREDHPSALHKFAKVKFALLFPPSLAERAHAAYLVARKLSEQASGHILRAQYHLPHGDCYYNFERSLLDRLHRIVLS